MDCDYILQCSHACAGRGKRQVEKAEDIAGGEQVVVIQGGESDYLQE